MRILKSLVQTKKHTVQKHLRTIADEKNKVNKIARLIDAYCKVSFLIWEKHWHLWDLNSISETMNGGFASLSQQLQSIQLNVGMQHHEPNVSFDDFLKWINAVSTHNDYHMTLQTQIENICSWALNLFAFQTWLTSNPLLKAAKMLWIKNKPETEKFIFTASLMKYLKNNEFLSICYFFCFYNYESKRRCNNIVESWISQLVKTKNIAVLRIAKKVYQKKNADITTQIE